ncbi:helix-turn-helix domain-containing protein [Dactylosporangium sp. NPDC049525]|uniref:helix-turn-helix domain-containing protein n=1 Tax=Dactylosporangium sp. NPDC049525 TaxID=3154730 RepID=UPI00343EB2AE
MPHRPGDLAALLTALKERSGLSHALIGQKVNLSKSAVHRYIAGRAVPHDFGTVERIARACGADREELDRLYPLWTAALRQQPAEAAEQAPHAEQTQHAEDVTAPEPGEAGTTVPAVAVPPTPPRRRWRTAALAALAAMLLVAGTAVATRMSLAPGPAPKHLAATASATTTPTPQWISGPTWALPAQPVPSEYFGVTINSGSGHMPGFTTGAVRLWDSETTWSRIQPARDQFDWTILDRLVEGARSHDLPVLFVVGGTPGWAAPNGPLTVYPDGARSAPPDDLTMWDTYISALVGRYQGRISAYELWVFANDPRLYSGSVETLVEMTRRANAIIRAADPKAVVVCPGMGNLWNAEGQQVLRRFAELGGYSHCHAAGIKLHQRSPEDPPETMLELTALIGRLFQEIGVHPPLWNTGTTYDIPLQGHLDAERARDYAVRFFLVGLLARTTNLQRMYFYNWGGTKIPIVLQPDGGAPTEAALAVQQLQRWVAGAQITGCGNGQAVELPQYVWQCEFVVSTPEGNRRALIRWTHAGPITLRAEAGAEAVLRLDGTTEPVSAGANITLTGTPVLIRYRL